MDKGVHSFIKGVCPKINVKARRQFELAYCHTPIQNFSDETPPFMLSSYINVLKVNILTELKIF